MRLKPFLLTLGILATVSLTTLHASTIVFSGSPTARTVTDVDTVTTITSGIALVGTFSSESFSFNPTLSISANIAAIISDGGWKQFTLDTSTGSLNSGATSSPLAITGSNPFGKLSGSITDNNSGPTKADFFNGKNLYVWVFNAATPGAATEMGIFRATSAGVPWVFPTNANGVGDSVAYSTTTSQAPTMVAVGGVGSTTSTQLILTKPVPEPSSLALGSLAGLGMLSSRWRRRK